MNMFASYSANNILLSTKKRSNEAPLTDFLFRGTYTSFGVFKMRRIYVLVLTAH